MSAAAAYARGRDGKAYHGRKGTPAFVAWRRGLADRVAMTRKATT